MSEFSRKIGKANVPFSVRNNPTLLELTLRFFIIHSHGSDASILYVACYMSVSTFSRARAHVQNEMQIQECVYL